MARYIDLDEAIKNIRTGDGTRTQKFFAECCLLCVPTADVAPKSEAAREIFAEIDANLSETIKKIANAKEGVCDDLVIHLNGKIGILEIVKDHIAELKKKYTEENHDVQR